jgi:hypothetical protein
MSSAAEAKVAGLFMNGKEHLPMQTALDKLGYTQPATPMRTDKRQGPDRPLLQTITCEHIVKID